MYPACGSPDLRAPQFSYFVWWPRSPRRPWTGFEFAECCASCNNRRSRCYSPVLGNVATQAQRAQVSCQDRTIKTQCEGIEEMREQRGLWRSEEPEGKDWYMQGSAVGAPGGSRRVVYGEPELAPQRGVAQTSSC